MTLRNFCIKTERGDLTPGHTSAASQDLKVFRMRWQPVHDCASTKRQDTIGLLSSPPLPSDSYCHTANRTAHFASQKLNGDCALLLQQRSSYFTELDSLWELNTVGPWLIESP